MNNVLDDAFLTSHIAFFWGYLAESTTSKNQRALRVYIPVLTPLRNGDISDKGSISTVELFNVVTQSIEKNDVHMSRTIYAEYLGFQSGRDVPDMYKGQQVLVMNYARSDQWFWIPIDRDDYIKTFEHTRLHCADIALVHKADVGDEQIEREQGLTDDNTYFIEIDTKYDKKILMSTSASDGEKYRYFFKIDPTDHTVTIWDNLSANPETPHNTIKIESDPTYSTGEIVKGRITLQNEAGSTLILEGPDIKLIAPRDITVLAGRNVVANIAGETSVVIKENTHIKILGNLFRQVFGMIHAEVKGLFTYLFGSNRVEDVVGNYTFNCTNHVETAALRTVTIQGADTLSANAIAVKGNTTISIMSGVNTTLGSTKVITFTAKNIGTSTHIFGCCGCIAH